MHIDHFNLTFSGRFAQRLAAAGLVWVLVECGGRAIDDPRQNSNDMPVGSGGDSSRDSETTQGSPTGGQGGEAPVGGTNGSGVPSDASGGEDATPPANWYCWTRANGMSGFTKCFCTSEVPPSSADATEGCDATFDSTFYSDCCFRYDDSGVDTCACYTLPGLGRSSCEEEMLYLEQAYPDGIRTSACPPTE